MLLCIIYIYIYIYILHNDELIIICIYPVRNVLCMLYIMLYYYIAYDLL